MSNMCGQQAVSNGKKNKAEQNTENPLLEELPSKDCITRDQIVIAGVNIITLLVVLGVFLFLLTFIMFLCLSDELTDRSLPLSSVHILPHLYRYFETHKLRKAHFSDFLKLYKRPMVLAGSK